MIPKKLWRCVFLCFLAYPYVKANINVKVTCADSMTLFADGVNKGTHNDKTSAKSVDIPSSTQVVGIQCTADKSSSTTAGILASFTMEYAGDYVTDGTWRCSNIYTAGWEAASFSDEHWLYATSPGDNSNSVPSGLSQVSAIAAHSKWIWTTDYATSSGDLSVYCRGHIEVKRSYDSYGRKFPIGFIENYASSKSNKLLITTLKPTDVTVYCFTPNLASTSSAYLSEVRTVNAATGIETISPSLSVRNVGIVVNGDKSILCVATEAVKIVGENQESSSSDLFLCIPVDGLGAASDSVEYYIVCWDTDIADDPRFLLVAAYDSTTITITPNDTISYDGTKNRPKGVPFTITLDKYKVAQMGEHGDILTGSRVVANKPISVYSGNKLTDVTAAFSSGVTRDHLIEQLVPVSSWGDKFSITPLPYGTGYRSYAHLAWYKLIAAKAGTLITIKAYSGTTLMDTKTYNLDAGEFDYYEHQPGYSAYVTSNTGIQLAQFATSSKDCIGDPWLQMIPPIYSFDRDYTVKPPSLTTGSCTVRNFITIIVKTAVKDKILIDGTLIGQKTGITKLGYNQIPGTDYSYQNIEIASTSELRVQHEDTNTNFGLYYYGYGSHDSYASMGGTRTAPINEPCVVSASEPGDGLDNDCNGEIDEDTCVGSEPSKDCAAPAPVNGGWSTWAVSGSCSCATGTGLEPYKRTCSNPVPQNNGFACDGSTTKTVSCTCVPVNGGWATWGSYGPCSTTCDPGVKTRTRTCTNPYPANGGQDCVASEGTETATCEVTPCPINGGWSSWSVSSNCSCATTQTTGSRNNVRTCTNPQPQHGGLTCSGSATQTESCTCAPIDGGWSSYGSYGSCSVTCGDGTKTKTRTCTNPSPAHQGQDCSGNSTESADCNDAPCPIDGGWSAFQDSGSCVCSSSTPTTGLQEQVRTCDDPTPQYGGASCVGNSTQEVDCNCTVAASADAQTGAGESNLTLPAALGGGFAVVAVAATGGVIYGLRKNKKKQKEEEDKKAFEKREVEKGEANPMENDGTTEQNFHEKTW